MSAAAHIEDHILIEFCEEVDGMLYPVVEEDPVGQSDLHLIIVRNLHPMVEALLKKWPGAAVFSDIFVYHQQGCNRRAVAPDLIAFPQVEKKPIARRAIYLWKEISRPIFVFEALSEDTEPNDLGAKREWYEDILRIPEYFIGDPQKEPMTIIGYRMEDGVYQSMEADEQGRLSSEQLGCWFGIGADGDIRVWDEAGEPIPSYGELAREKALAQRQARTERERSIKADERARQEALRAQEQSKLRAAAEARIRELEEQIQRLGVKP